MTIGLLLEENRMRWTGPHSCQWTACPSLSPHFHFVNISLTGKNYPTLLALLSAVDSQLFGASALQVCGLWRPLSTAHWGDTAHRGDSHNHLGVFKTFPGLCSYQNSSYRSSRGLLRDWWTIGFWMVAQDNGFYSLAYGTGSLLWRYDWLSTLWEHQVHILSQTWDITGPSDSVQSV